MNRFFLAGTSPVALREWAKSHNLPAFRGTQVAGWVYEKGVVEPKEMNNLPLSVRELLKTEFFAPGTAVSETAGSEDGTEKLLLTLHDGETVEMVLIPAEERLTFCLSTQVGCPVQCRFCASGRDGLIRNLAAGEILEEFLLGSRRAGRRPDNLVFMGIGEGLLNFRELAAALEMLTSPEGFGMSPRRITVSTSGYVPGMRKFAELGREFTLAVSLHAPDDETRSRLIPDKLRYPVAEIMEAADFYLQKAGRMVTLEYTLLAGFNDTPVHARALGELAVRHHCKVNLIPYNSTGGEFRRPSRQTIREFEDIVAVSGAHVTVRVERGAKSVAACGQLRTRAGRRIPEKIR